MRSEKEYLILHKELVYSKDYYSTDFYSNVIVFKIQALVKIEKEVNPELTTSHEHIKMATIKQPSLRTTEDYLEFL